LSKSSGFSERKTQKITAFAFVTGFIESCSKGYNTYSSWAAGISNVSGKTVSKQAVFDRMNKAAVSFAEKLFSTTINAKLKTVKDGSLCKAFKRVLLQDSTTLSLPDYLVSHFPGNVSKGKQKAVARLQCIINITNMQWLHLSLDAFTNNDQSASGIILPLLKKGDLLIRDLGYFVLDVLEQVVKREAFFISRLRYGVTLFDTTGKAINWKQLCKASTGIIDRQVLVGKQQKMAVRIVMIPLPKTIVNQRIRKAKQDRDKRLNHSKDYYVWLRYNVFITNVATEKLEGKAVADAYKIRWQIEILFKSWKSAGNLQQILHEGCTNICRVKTSIYLLLMFFCLIMQKVYMHYGRQVTEKYNKQLSLMKVFMYLVNNIKCICTSPLKLREQLAKYCSYEKRKDRLNMTELITNCQN
jgi:hypothetical protein